LFKTLFIAGCLRMGLGVGVGVGKLVGVGEKDIKVFGGFVITTVVMAITEITIKPISNKITFLIAIFYQILCIFW
jgi:hypothetical protein